MQEYQAPQPPLQGYSGPHPWHQQQQHGQEEQPPLPPPEPEAPPPPPDALPADAGKPAQLSLGRGLYAQHMGLTGLHLMLCPVLSGNHRVRQG